MQVNVYCTDRPCRRLGGRQPFGILGRHIELKSEEM